MEGAVVDQIGDGAKAQVVLLRKGFEIGEAGHGAVFVHDLHDHRRRGAACKARQIHGGFRMARSTEHPTGLGHEGEDVPRGHDVIGGGGRIDGDGDGLRAVGSGNPRGHPLRRFDGHGEVGVMLRPVAGGHGREPQLPAPIDGHGHANEATGVARHEVHGLGGDMLRRHNEIAFVFPIFVVQEHDHLACAQVFDELFNGGKGHSVRSFNP